MAQPTCNVCGGSQFADFNGRQKARCDRCGSLERHRMIALVVDRLKIRKTARVLVIAPDRSLLLLLRNRGISRIMTADLDPDRYRAMEKDVVKLDLTAVDHRIWKKRSFDLVIHSHVIEHVPATLASPMYELFRLMKPHGKQIAVIPFMSGRYQENFDDLPAVERHSRFGQHDHVRRIGKEDVEMTLGKIVKLRPVDFSSEFTHESLRAAQIPEYLWRGLNFSTVNVFARADFLLSKL